MSYRFSTFRLLPVVALPAALAVLAGCSLQKTVATPKSNMAPPPPVNVQQAIQNTAPPPLNLPANMPADQKQKIIAQEQDQWQAQKIAAQRMFAAASAQHASDAKH